MLWITVIIALLISAVALWFVAWPLLQTEDEPIWVEDDRLSDLLTRKDSTLRAIKELEFDYQVGKVSEEDYARFDQRLRRQAIGYIRQIERLTPYTAALEDELEAEIARQRRTVGDGDRTASMVPESVPESVPERAAAPAAAVVNAASEGTVAAASTASTHFCTECGRSVTPTQRFCGHCGTRLVLAEEGVEDDATGPAVSEELSVAQER